MDKFCFARGLPTESNITSPCLIIPGVGYGRNLLIAVHGGDQNFDVIGAGHGGRAVPRRQLHRAEVEAQIPHQSLCLGNQLVKGLVGLLRQGVLEHLDLVKLMSPYHSPLVCPMAACLPSETGGVGKELMGQLRLGENFVAVQGSQGRFRRGKHEVHPLVGGIFDLIDLVGKLGELARRLAALVLQHVRQDHHFVAVTQMAVHEIVQKGPFQTGAHAPIDPETAACQLGAPLIVDEAQVGAKVYMVLGRKIKLVLLAAVAQRLVILLAPGDQILVRQVGKGQHQRAVFCFNLRQELVIFGNFRLQFPHALENRRHIFSRLFLHGDLLGDLVLLCLAGLRLQNQRPTFPVQLQNAVDLLVAVYFLGPKTGLHLIRIVLNPSDIQHILSPQIAFNGSSSGRAALHRAAADHPDRKIPVQSGPCACR